MNVPLSDSLKKYLIPLFQRKAIGVTAIDVSGFTSYADTLIIVEAGSSRQVQSIAEHVIKELKKQNIKVLGAEGVKEGEWALLDYGDPIIHIFQSEVKSLYDLEGFWTDAPRIDLSSFNQPAEDRNDSDDTY